MAQSIAAGKTTSAEKTAETQKGDIVDYRTEKRKKEDIVLHGEFMGSWPGQGT